MTEAPMDGYDILIITNKGRCFVAGWVKNSIIHKRGVWMTTGGYSVDPDFWMPLPEPPGSNPEDSELQQILPPPTE
jgi:hypothetical protein